MPVFTTSMATRDDSTLQREIMNAYDWGELGANALTYSFINHVGTVQSTDQTEIMINDRADVASKITLANNKVLVIGALDANSAAYYSLDVLAGNTAGSNLDLQFEVGDTFYLNGLITSGTARGSAIIRIVEKGSDKKVKFKTLDIKKASDAVDATSFTSVTATPTTLLYTSIDAYDSDAKDGTTISPNNFSNAMQFGRSTVSQALVDSVQKGFYNKDLMYQAKMKYTRFMEAINRGILFSTTSRIAATASATAFSSASILPKHDGGTGENMGVMGGIPRFLRLYNTSLNTGDAAPITRIDSGTTVTWANLKSFFATFGQGGQQKFAICAPEFLNMLEDAAATTYGTTGGRFITMGEDMYKFPRAEFKMRTFEIGNIMLTVIADKNMSAHTPRFCDGTSIAAHQKMMYIIDPKHIGLSYMEMPEYGVLAPKIVEIAQTNNALRKSMEVMYGCTLAMDNLPAHGAYGITNAG